MSVPCHAVRLRLPGTPTEQTAAARAAATRAGGRLWVEPVSFPAAAPQAAARRATELTRAATSVRCVLLRYRDGAADLVIVASRATRTADDLRRAVATGTPSAVAPLLDSPAAAASQASGAAPAGDQQPAAAASAAGPAPAWGLGGGAPGRGWGTAVAPTGGTGDTGSWRAALAVTLYRYAGHGADPTVALDTDEGPVAVTIEGTLGELRQHPGVPTSRAPNAALCTAALGAPVGTEYRWLPGQSLLVTVDADGRGGRVRADFPRAHYTPAAVERFLHSLLEVHRQVRDAAQTPAAAATLLSADASAEVARLGRAVVPLSTIPECVHSAFARVAATTPDAVAVCDAGRRLTYRELALAAQRSAAGLRAAGVRPGDRVGVCLHRGADLVTTLLAVLQAGAAYVPTDPTYPVERLAYTAADAGLRVVVTERADFPADGGIRAVSPSELQRVVPDGTPPVAVSPGDPAYVIYTSGSTGRPKGVVVPHRNVTALVDAVRDEYRLSDNDVWSQFHSSAFDFSVWEIWGCLLTGGRLVAVPYFVAREPDKLRDLLVAERVTVLSQTPSAFAQLLDTDHGGLSTRLVVFGGEALDARMLLRWFDRHPEDTCQVVNMFGITETTVHVTARTVTRALALTASRSVGPALPGWYLSVRDGVGQLAPVGVPGEICVGGAGVAAGYLNQPELTARRFVADPYAEGRVYLSGDLGRLLPDGSLEHLGRIDSQVKVRGFRVELDEIRAVLTEDPTVRGAAVVVRRPTAAASSARIDAYVVLDGGDPAEVRRRAARLLPDYMMPATVTPVSALPLTTNGKLDTARLPAPLPALSRAGADSGPPTGDDVLTVALREVWSQVLRVSVGPDDDFFELGGNSLAAVQIGAAMRARGLPGLALRELYRHPSIRGVVAHLTATASR